jgi:cytochrome c oxidase cbb3-type subunit 3
MFLKSPSFYVAMKYKRRIIRGAVCTFLLFGVSWHAGEATPQSNGAARSKQAGEAQGDAKKTFESTCAACHGLDGRGGERGPNIATNQQVQHLPDSEILQIMREGRGYAGMPGFASLGDSRLQAILSHLRKLQGRDSRAAVTGNAAKGKAAFFGKGGCSSCHMIQGVGGYIAGDLSQYGANNSPPEVRDAILHPNNENDPRQHVVAVTVEDGQTFTGVIRNEDNFSLQLQTLDGIFHLLPKNALKSVKEQSRSLMPTNYETILSPQDIDDLAGYLVTVAKTQKKSPTTEDPEED